MTERLTCDGKLTRRHFLLTVAGWLVYTMLPSCRSTEIKRSRRQAIHNSPNFKNGVFSNPLFTSIYTDSNPWDVFWRFISKPDHLLEPVHKLKFRSDVVFHNPFHPKGLWAMWIGHSTVLIEIDGKRFLSDPVWSKKLSPFGPVRFFDPPITLDRIPELDGVIVSHDHLDHLDRETIKRLGKRGVAFYVPLGVGHHLDSWGIPNDQINELDWWDQVSVGKNHVLIATPARHFSGRGLFDRNTTLWSSWIIKGKEHTVFFGGDGGMWPGFKDIGDNYGPFDLSLLQIGAYSSSWKNIHMFPEEAVQAHLDLKAEVLLPIHWGSFNLAFHTWTDPIERLLVSAREKNIKLSVPCPGQHVCSPHISVNADWWEQKHNQS